MFYNQDNSSSPIKFTPGRDNSYSSHSDVGTRPTGDPKSRKDFKKVLGKSSQDEDEEEKQPVQNEGEGQELIAEEAVSGKKKAPPSLFDLTSGRTRQNDPAAFAAGQAAAGTVLQGKEDLAGENQSPSAVFAKLSNPEAKKGTLGDEIVEIPVAPQEKDKFTTRFSTEQPDLSYVNPMMNTAPQAVDMRPAKAEQPLPAANIQAIINQLVEKVTELKDSGRTETIVTLKHPPILAGTNLVVTAYDSARGQFNISFENLTQKAKELLDMRVNHDSLLLALEKKGYTVQILTTTTITENRPIIEAPPTREREQSRQDTAQDQRRQRNREEEGTG